MTYLEEGRNRVPLLFPSIFFAGLPEIVFADVRYPSARPTIERNCDGGDAYIPHVPLHYKRMNSRHDHDRSNGK